MCVCMCVCWKGGGGTLNFTGLLHRLGLFFLVYNFEFYYFCGVWGKKWLVFWELVICWYFSVVTFKTDYFLGSVKILGIFGVL